MTTGDPQPTPSGQDTLREALAFLSGEGRRRSPERLLEGLKERFREAGRERLADLVYEMAKACLSSFPDCAGHVDMLERPRRAEVISGEMQTMNACLDGLTAAGDLSSVARRTPTEQEALDDAHKCLDVLQTLEGRSDRHELARALAFVHGDQPERAEPLLRPIAESPDHADLMRRSASVNLAFSLFRQGRAREVVELTRRALRSWPDRATLYFNLISAAAELRERDEFEAAVRELGALRRARPSGLIDAWAAHDLVVMGGWLGVDAARIEELLAD